MSRLHLNLDGHLTPEQRIRARYEDLQRERGSPGPAPRPIDQMTQAEMEAEIRAGRRFHNGALPAMSPEARAALAPAGEAETLGDLMADSLRRHGQPVPANDRDMIRAAMSSVGGVGALESHVNTQIQIGFGAGSDSTEGWVRRQSLPNFLVNEIGFADQPARLVKLAKGKSAASVSFNFSAPERWRLARFACQFSIGEEDAVDWVTSTRLPLINEALREVGAAAKRLLGDLVYGLLLSNPALADGTTLFHASRGNLSTLVFNSTNLPTAFGAIGSQVQRFSDGDPAHINLEPGHLIVAPNLQVSARKEARDMEGGGHSTRVHPESRFTTAGVVDPDDENTLITSNGTTWLLACSNDQGPSIVLGALDGNFQPVMRAFVKTKGEWGTGFDLCYDVGVVALSGKPLYLSTGTGL